MDVLAFEVKNHYAVLQIAVDRLKMFLQGVSVVEQLDVTVTGTASCTQPTQDAAVTIETKLKDMHEFLANYMLTITEE